MEAANAQSKRLPQNAFHTYRWMRIGIVRAFLKHAPLLIMDEAANHLDTGNEQLLFKWKAS